MNIPGGIKIITNIDDVNAAIYAGFKVIALTENNNFGGAVLPGTTLLPPYEALMHEVENDFMGFRQIYTMHLAKKENDMFICAIIRALMEGINIALYVPKDEAELMFSKVLVQYLSDVYGISILPSGSVYNIAFDAGLLTKLYVYELITKDEFFILYPANINLINDPFLIQKLMMEMNPYIEDKTGLGYYNYFNNYMMQIKNNGNRIPVSVISYE